MWPDLIVVSTPILHGPCLVRPRGLLAVIAQSGLDPAPWRFVAQLQAQFLVKPIDAFGIDRQTIPPQQDVNAAHPCLANTFDPVLEIRLVATLRLVNIQCAIDSKGRTGPPDRDFPVAAQPVDKFAFAARPQSFFARTSWSIALSKDRSATIRFNLLFSSSS